MDKYKLNWTSLQARIFSLLCERVGEKLSQRDIAKALGVSPTAVGNSLKRLGSLISVERNKTINLVSLNRDSRRTFELKRVENLKAIYLSGLADGLGDSFPGCAVILFGSYSRGEDTVKSDIDIAVIGSGKQLDLGSYETILKRKIVINFYKSLEDINALLKSNILNGIILSGSI